MPEAFKVKKLVKAWDQIESQMIELQLKDSSFITELKKEARYYLKMINSDIGSPLDKVVFNAEKEKKEANEKPFDYHMAIAILEKHLHFNVDDKKMSVTKFYTHWKLLKDGREEN